MRRVSVDDIKKMNEVYYNCHSYAQTARETGWSPATVRAYIDKNYSPVLEENIHRFDPNTEFPKEFSNEIFMGLDNFGVLCLLSDDEKNEIRELWKELSV